MQNLQFKRCSNLLTKCCFFNIYKSTHFGTGGQVSICGRTKTYWKSWRSVAPQEVLGMVMYRLIQD